MMEYADLTRKRLTVDIEVIKNVIGSDPTMTVDDIYDQRDALADQIQEKLNTEYQAFYCEVIDVTLADFDTPKEIDDAIAREQALVIDKRAEQTAIEIAGMKEERRLAEGRAAAAFQREAGTITRESIDLTRMENQKLWIETIREGMKTGNVSLVVTETPMLLGDRAFQDK